MGNRMQVGMYVELMQACVGAMWIYRDDVIEHMTYCHVYTGFPRSCNNTVQANLRTRKIVNGKFGSPQP